MARKNEQHDQIIGCAWYYFYELQKFILKL